ncbi:MAG: precorrin-6A reductase [Spirochaetaceae bacterium]|jgi:precorrin-2 dehydrogenase/sirohydrochlorin ferrochelatase/precorrin-6A/cobalt-precorrin-6A reductase|nr:precorrin-6A reductase [Spirochaetaceae bacterium]
MRVFIFAGTGDGKKLTAALLDTAAKKNVDLEIWVFCATEYGAELLENEIEWRGEDTAAKRSVRVRRGRLDGDEILKAIKTEGPDYVVDCTHPFAKIVSQNIRAACENLKCPCLRLLRDTRTPPPASLDVVYVDSLGEAAAFLQDKPGNIFLTTGSKEIRAFSAGAFAGRVYPRVLPLDESLRVCREAGVAAKNIIAMQGPFSEELNRAVLRHINASWLVSKETGAEGGFLEKMNAALAENCRVLAVRPPKEDGLDAGTIISIICGPPVSAGGPSAPAARKLSEESGAAGGRKKFFPVFQDISGKKFLIAGAGAVALRRLRTLLRFDCRVEIVAPEIRREIEDIRDERVTIRRDVYRPGSLGADFVIAATNNRAVNKSIADEGAAKNIPVSVSDRKEESTFYFPAVVCTDVLIAGITSDGRDHRAVSGAARRIEELFREEDLGQRTPYRQP